MSPTNSCSPTVFKGPLPRRRRADHGPLPCRRGTHDRGRGHRRRARCYRGRMQQPGQQAPIRHRTHLRLPRQFPGCAGGARNVRQKHSRQCQFLHERSRGSRRVRRNRRGTFDTGRLRRAACRKSTLVVMSNSPQFCNPCSGWNPTPIRVIEWDPQQGHQQRRPSR